MLLGGQQTGQLVHSSRPVALLAAAAAIVMRSAGRVVIRSHCCTLQRLLTLQPVMHHVGFPEDQCAVPCSLPSWSAGISGAAAVPLLHFPSEAGSPLESQRSALSSSRQPSSAHALASSAAVAATEAAAPSASPQRASRGSLVMQQLSESVLSELASQQPGQQPAALRHPSVSSTAFGRGLEQQKGLGEGDKQRDRAEASTECRAGGKRRKSRSCHAADPAMEHVEDHLQILKHVHVKHASPR